SNAIYTEALTMAFQESFMLIALVFFVALIPTCFMRIKRN
ncbi:MAG: hypothetical protein ACJA2O_004274, partial [Candidatus Azotimanducaceae bacterium]